MVNVRLRFTVSLQRLRRQFAEQRAVVAGETAEMPETEFRNRFGDQRRLAQPAPHRFEPQRVQPLQQAHAPRGLEARFV